MFTCVFCEEEYDSNLHGPECYDLGTKKSYCSDCSQFFFGTYIEIKRTVIDGISRYIAT